MEALTSFKNGEANVIVTVKAFDEGVDVPDADVGIIYQSTKGTRQAIQRLGRVVRKAQDGDEEKNPMLYYLYHPEYQAEFLKDYFENPYKLYHNAFDDDSEDDVVNNTTEDKEELIKGRGPYEQAV
jgi:superfamily II DNA or RNA helicase